jgi:hypothetical protein
MDVEEVVHEDPRAATSKADATGTPQGGTARPGWEGIDPNADYEIEYMGAPAIVKGEKLKTLVQQGYRFSDRKRELEQTYNEKLASLTRDFEPFQKFEATLKADPQKRKLVKAVMTGNKEALAAWLASEEGGARTAPGFRPGAGDGEGGSDDYYEQQFNRLRHEFDAKLEDVLGRVSSQIGEVGGGVAHLAARARDSEEVAFLKSNPKFSRFADDDTIELARDHQRRFGGSLVDAFKNVTWDNMPDKIESEVVQRFGIDREILSTPGSRPPVVNGLTLDEKTMQRLFDDPDELAKHADAIKSHRRKERGLRPVARSGRR